MLMVRAIERGLFLNDFENMTVGMIVGYITTYNEINSDNSNEEAVREAAQNDFNSF